MSDDDNIFSRWSQRKRGVAKEEAVIVPDEPDAPVAPELPDPQSEEDEAALLEKLGLPRPESLGTGDDFSVFMKIGVPEFLRKRALRVLWRSNPVLANLDGLNDYDDDFRSPELTRKVLATAYKVGRGFLPPEPVAEVLQEDTEESHPETDVGDETASEVASIEEPDSEAKPTDPEAPEKTSDNQEHPPRPSRMRFET